MAYLLGNITLPNPKSFRREVVEKSAMIVTLNNTTKKDITGRKYRYILGYRFLTQSEVASIMSEYDLETTRDFQVTETNLTVASTPVHVTIDRREYNTPGNEYREDLTLILEEVQ